MTLLVHSAQALATASPSSASPVRPKATNTRDATRVAREPTRDAEPEKVPPDFAPSDYRMLIVDDDPEVGEALELFFDSLGYGVTRASDGETALEYLARDSSFDVVLLDVMLPRMNGFEVLQEVQERGYVPPVLMISGRGEQETILRSFGLGASDYVVKPFNPDELAARVRAILGRTLPVSEERTDVITFGNVEVNFSTYKVQRDGQPLELSEVEFDILRQVLLHRGQVVTRKRLLRDALGIDDEVFSFEVDPETIARTLDRHITSLRTKLEPNPYEPRYIQTVYGQGYRFNEQEV